MRLIADHSHENVKVLECLVSFVSLLCVRILMMDINETENILYCINFCAASYRWILCVCYVDVNSCLLKHRTIVYSYFPGCVVSQLLLNQ